MSKQYKIIFLDWDGTLSNSKFWDHLRKDDIETWKILENSLFDTFKSLINPWMIGNYTTETIIKKVSNNTILSYDKIYSEFVKSCKEMQLIDIRIPSLIRNIQKRGTKVVIATDNMDSFRRWTIPSLQLDNIFDDILISCEIKALKGDFDNSQSIFFEAYLNKQGVKPQDCILFDNSDSLEKKINSFGMEYIKVNRDFNLAARLKIL